MTPSTPQPERSLSRMGRASGVQTGSVTPKPEATDERRQRAERVRELLGELRDFSSSGDITAALELSDDIALALEDEKKAVEDERASLEAEREVLRGIVKRYQAEWEPAFQWREDPRWFRLGGSPQQDDYEPMSPDEARILSELGDQT